MNITIAPSVYDRIPDFKAGIIQYEHITVSDSPQMLKGRLRLFQEQLHFDLMDKKVTDYGTIQDWRRLFKTLGSDPNRYRPSAEALYRRIAKQQFLDPVHSAVDMNTFLSLQYGIPLGLYDADKIKGDVLLAVGDETDTYEGINNRVNTLADIPVTKDSRGAFGSPYVDSKRTAVTAGTVNALHVFYFSPSMEPAEGQQLLQAAGTMFTQISGGEFEARVLYLDRG
ncbi:B3/4 domain-containing protein [Indiicoccus explosivorum]|uniref:B3/B4 domain-containing protein n=1 Tax=Indiicoccus explosivorum TaxID=1917864 RepID=UPI000B43F008|nr:phenylalanine--tRNA ligase beta subunit-related protein [Indiicoccus explosivorum]